MHVRAIAVCAAVILTPPAAAATQAAPSRRPAQHEATVKEEKAGLLAQAAIRPDSAIRVAAQPASRAKS